MNNRYFNMDKSKIRLLRLSVTLLFMTCFTPALFANREPLNVIKESNAGLRRVVMDNGMICLIKPDHSAPVCSIQVWVRAGSMDEREFLGAGMSHFVEHMIFKGTDTRKPGDITREINDAGGMINAYTTLDRTVFYVNMPSDKWKTGLDVLADAVMNTSFPEDEWKKERDVIVREMAMNLDNPDRVLSRMLWSTAFMLHPIRHPVIGYEDVFLNVTREDLVTFYRRNYVPNEMIVVVTGDITQEEMESALKKTFAGFQRGAKEPVLLPEEPVQLASRFRREYDQSAKISRLACAFHTVDITHADSPALDVLANITGSGRSSVLVEKFKENLKLVHSISAWSFTPKVPGLFGISASYEPGKETELLEKLKEEVASWHNRPFSETDLRKARRAVLTSTLSGLETMEGQAASYASGEFYASDPLFSETYIERLNAVTTEQLREVAAKYLTPENMTTVILAPESETEQRAEAVLAVVPGAPRKTTLKNGLRLVTREDRKLPFVYGCIVLGGGLLSENEGNNGITKLMAELLTRGTTSQTGQDIARTVEALGGSLTAFSGYNSFGLQFQCLTEDTDVFFRLAADCLIESSFIQEEIDKQKNIQLSDIARQRESPMYIASMAMRSILFPNHPYGFDVSGTTRSVEKISRPDIQEHHRKALVTHNAVLAVFGDISEERAISLAENSFGTIPADRAPVPEHAKPAPELPGETKLFEPVQQTIFITGFPGVDVKDPRLDALNILREAMSGLSSRLMIEIRDKRGLAYFAGAWQQAGVDPGLFAVYAGTKADAASEVASLVFEEIRRVTENGLDEAEFERARAQLISARKHSFQNNASTAMESALNELYGLGFEYSFTEPERLNSLTTEEVRQAASELLSRNKSAIVTVMPESEKKAETTGGTNE